MKQKRQVGILCLTCIVTAILIIGLLFVKNGGTTVAEPATSYEQLAMLVHFSGDVQKVNGWLDESSGIYYFFLPTGSERAKITLNLGEDCGLQLGEFIYSGKDSLCFEEGGLEYNMPYEAELTVAGESLGVQQMVIMKSANLPSLFIETQSGTLDNIHESKEVKEKAAITLFDSEGIVAYDNDIEYIKTRGNSSFYYFDKKPYQIKLLREASLLEMPSAEKWVLLANGIDSTLLKNDIVFRFAHKYTSVPSIQGEYVDLYVNGNYEGNYYLCERIEIGKNRLNITNQEERPGDITGGYLVEHTEVVDEVPENSFTTDKGHCYIIVSPENATAEQKEYICGLFNEMEVAMEQENGIHPDTGKHFSEYINVESWAEKYMMEEVFQDPDAVKLSAYFYKDADSVDAHIYAGPMWDYDRAMGSYGNNKYAVDAPEQVGKCGIYVEEMMQHEEVRNLVYEKFGEKMVPYVNYLAASDIYQLDERIEASAEMNQVRWKPVFGYYKDAEAQRDYLITFLEKKTDYLEGVWLDADNTCEVVFLDYDGDVYASYAVKRGECLAEEPRIATWVAIFNGWYSVDRGVPFSTKLPIYEDVTYQAKWIEMDAILENGLSSTEIDISQVDADTFRQFADLIESRQSLQSGQTTQEGQNASTEQ
ncbi:MAG: CotH kinase family protein [Lachnospiraceae bacterium]|nr:CotH kinase family protein [Lachnospiraceae bacterium]